jgi:hypothetical protein
VTEWQTDWLEDVTRLRLLIQRYARAVDSRDIAAVASLFSPDALVEGARGTLPLDEYLATFDGERPFRSSMHLLGDPLIDLVPGADIAQLDTYGVVYQLERRVDPGNDVVLGVRYRDSAVRQAGVWRIQRRHSEIMWSRDSPPRTW